MCTALSLSYSSALVLWHCAALCTYRQCCCSRPKRDTATSGLVIHLVISVQRENMSVPSCQFCHCSLPGWHRPSSVDLGRVLSNVSSRSQTEDYLCASYTAAADGGWCPKQWQVTLISLITSQASYPRQVSTRAQCVSYRCKRLIVYQILPAG